MLAPEPRRKRTWEIVSGLALLLLVAGIAGTYLRHQSDNRELALAIDASNWRRASHLLKRGANPQVRGLGGATVLTLAANVGDPDLLRLGLARGLDPNVRDYYGMTPLMWAAGHGSYEVTEALMKAGADLQARTPDGYTALTFVTPVDRDITVRDPVTRTTNTFHRPTKSQRIRRTYRLLKEHGAR